MTLDCELHENGRRDHALTGKFFDKKSDCYVYEGNMKFGHGCRLEHYMEWLETWRDLIFLYVYLISQ